MNHQTAPQTERRPPDSLRQGIEAALLRAARKAEERAQQVREDEKHAAASKQYPPESRRK